MKIQIARSPKLLLDYQSLLKELESTAKEPVLHVLEVSYKQN